MEGNVTGVPLRPLGVSELLDAAARVVRRNLGASIAIALPVEVVRTLLVTLLAYEAIGSPDTEAASPIPGARPDIPLGWLLLQILVGSLALTLLSGLLAPLYVEDALGRRLTAAQAVKRIGRSWLPLVGLTVIVALGYELGLVLLVVGGVWLWGVWALAGPALVTERLGPIRALRRSFELAKGFWRVWGIRALGYLVITVLGSLLTVPAALLAGWLGARDFFGGDGEIVHPVLYLSITALGALLAGTLLSPFRAAVDTMLYLDARMRREGLDIAITLDADARDHAAERPAPAPSAW